MLTENLTMIVAVILHLFADLGRAIRRIIQNMDIGRLPMSFSSLFTILSSSLFIVSHLLIHLVPITLVPLLTSVFFNIYCSIFFPRFLLFFFLLPLLLFLSLLLNLLSFLLELQSARVFANFWRSRWRITQKQARGQYTANSSMLRKMENFNICILSLVHHVNQCSKYSLF